jgi:hypothetical protein
MRSRVQVFEEIRRDRRTGGMSIRQLAERHEVHRRTVRQALGSPVPPERKAVVRAAPVREAVAGWIDAMLAGTWTRRVSSGIRRGGSPGGSGMSVTRRCRIRVCASWYRLRRMKLVIDLSYRVGSCRVSAIR